MKIEEFKNSCGKIKLTPLLDDNIWTRAEQQADEKRRKKTIPMRVRWSYAASLAAVVLLVGSVIFSTVWKQNHSVTQQGEIEPARLEATAENVYNFMFYLTDTTFMDDLEMLMIVTMNHDTRQIVTQQIYPQSVTKDPNRDGAWSTYEWLFIRHGAEKMTSLVADELGIEMTDYVETDLEGLAEMIDLAGGLEFSIEQKDIMHEQDGGRDISDYLYRVKDKKYGIYGFWHQVGAGTYDGSISAAWMLCPENSGEAELRLMRGGRIVAMLMEKVQKMYGEEQFAKYTEKMEGRLVCQFDAAEQMQKMFTDDYTASEGVYIMPLVSDTDE